MKIGVVVHGAEAIDSGFALKTITMLKDFGEVSICLGGSMGRTAVIDHSLENLIDIRHRERPSRAVQRMIDEGCDVVCLVNYGKTLETGILFAELVLGRIKTQSLAISACVVCSAELVLSRIKAKDVPVLLIEGAGAIGCTSSCELTKALASSMKLPVYSFNAKKTVEYNKNHIVRHIKGVLPGELVQINGIIIGRARGPEITVITENSIITGIKGCYVKVHGLKKLKQVDLATAIIRSGTPRHSVVNTRQTRSLKNMVAVLIDHDAESSFEKAKNACVAVTIGDDTTAVAADILYRFSTPVIGITDGDKDGLLEHTRITSGSLVIKVRPGFDDLMGTVVKDAIFKGLERVKCLSIDRLKEQIIKLLDDNIVSIERY
ncbi:MAG: hypothetical protein DNFNHJIP_00155 [Candidatus Argoarchaeum ethanivorans]|uniref:DUF2117 domain-containing protein n=1 Tax=Candidatus Argoarchaeum ethanivorans TaxID=2608793 RepID=A0A812A1S0_9EURY|nr:MAG: hypothetical protein DNFNHJIP_00155 [Candidatus Argoarchaeum ethanivorans]